MTRREPLLPPLGGGTTALRVDGASSEVDAAAVSDVELGELLAHLRSDGVDLSGYRRSGLERGLRRRMQRLGCHDLSSYRAYVAEHPEERHQLHDALLINVTAFFRNLPAWEAMALHLARALDGRSDLLRVWSAGCATGEEPYSLAMVLAERLGLDVLAARVRIFATNLHEDALARARRGVYTADALAGVPAAYAARYFRKRGDVYVIDDELRRVVVFGRHDLVHDAPISRVDVIACRNLLMYFDADTQSRLLRRLRFALKPAGVLFLGNAELLLQHGDLFSTLDSRSRIFGVVANPARLHEGAVDTALAALTFVRASDGAPDGARGPPSSPSEQLELTTEELRTANDELHATNGELQAIGAELGTTNDELVRMNERLRTRSVELTRLGTFLESILDSLPEGVAVLDPDLGVRAWNGAMAVLSGARAEDVSGRNLLELDVGLPIAQLEPALRACLASRDEVRLTIDVADLRGERVRRAVTVISLAGDDRGVVVLVGDAR